MSTAIPYNPKLRDRSRELRNGMTEAEKKLWHQFLRTHDLRFTRQKPIHQFIVDFYCSEAKLVVEIDGEIHETSGAKAYDEQRTAIIESYGLKVIRFSNQEVMGNFSNVKTSINEAIDANLVKGTHNAL